MDKNLTYPCALEQLKEDGDLWRRSLMRQCKFLNNIVEQDHRRMKRLVRPGLGSGGLQTARITVAGYEAMAMIRKRQVRKVGGRDMRARATCMDELFQAAA
ncbi:DDE domain-containing protein [Pseudoroseomonas wenyumeiae]|uniref:DDE domain-containing protein n=1 Tax=Teichococcus wenyumeiae TaxID=2478470 RepID=A0A3A9JVJ4_9PROT|nr:DDE-type integrase/transposase/recombinase [Pseudoroseomonas wenyumeiae]RKK03029.1 DDE domain-containing protein [Pseudoroseomonas wenyumeiae]RMI15523.1 DDE domain-containing protein [Pseudoroseomonas wenyumeiae]